MKIELGILCLWLGCWPVAAADMASVRLLALDGPLAEGVPASVERFVDKSLVIPAVFLKNTAQPANLTCDVYADGDALGALLSKEVRFESMAGPPSHPWLLEGVFTVTLPESGKARLRIIIHAQDNDKTDHLIGQCAVQITPPGELKAALEKAGKSDKESQPPRLLVFGTLTGLRELLNQWKVLYEEGGRDMPAKLPPGTLAIGEAENIVQIPELTTKSSLWILRADAFADAGVIVKQTPQNCLTLVKAPRPETWQQSPFLHRQLIAQIQRHLDLHE